MGANIEQRSNDALRVNPNVFTYPVASDINITTHGSDIYWAVCALMTFSTIAFLAHSLTVPRRNRVFHYITAAITMTAAIAYFTMGSNLGYAAIPVEFHRTDPRTAGVFREIFYVRYIDWVVTTPLLLLDLLLTAGLPWPTILWTIFVDEVMIITGLVGALVGSRYKWGYYVFGNAAFFIVVYNLVFNGYRHAKRINPQVLAAYRNCGILTIFLWFLYPVAWGVSEGGNLIAPDSEAIFYGILDALAKPVFGALLLYHHRNIDPAVLGLHIRDYDDVAHPDEKHGGIGSAAAHHNHDKLGNGAGTGAAGGNDYGVLAGGPMGANGAHGTEGRAQNIATDESHKDV